jgi:uncharacterized protein (DUF1015 family)
VPELRTFRGIRYGGSPDMRKLVCPPYDIISPEEQARLYARHPHNAVRVELPFSEAPDEAEEERYRRADRHFREWLAEGVLVEDDEDGLYVYRQDFVARDGTRRRVSGVIGALTLERFGEDTGIFAHERTMPGPIEDRLALLRACPVNISPIYAIYRGAGELGPYLESLEHRPPAARFPDEHGTLHRLWRITAPAETEMLAEAVGRHPLVIADGHHRYETALAFHAENHEGAGHHDAVMCFCVDADAEELEVLPYNRALIADVTGEEVESRLLQSFRSKQLSSGEGVNALTASAADHPLLFVFPHSEVLIELSDEEVVARVGDRADAWRRLDVVALHEVVLPEVLADELEQVVFSSDPSEVLSLVEDKGWTAGVLLRPLHASQVIEVARSGERMPQKASYFWPKAVTGLVFRSLR